MSNKTPKSPKIIYDFNPNNLPPEYLQAIGLITAVSAQTESILQEFIGALLKIDNIQNTALTTHMTIPLMINIIKTLAEIEARSVKEIDKIDELIETAGDAIGKRNTIVHNALIRNTETGEVLVRRLSARGSIKQELRTITVMEIEQDAAAIYNAGEAIIDFMTTKGLEPIMRTKPFNTAVKRGIKERSKRVSL